MAQASLDGLIVPFSSVLPVCASLCGPLFDAQGRCTPPVTAAVDDECFCSDTKITPLASGLIYVSSVCGPASCTSETDLKTVHQWYSDYCRRSTKSNGSGDSPISVDGGSKQQSWISVHFKWIILLIVIFMIITAVWITACTMRRRYLRKKEKNLEITDPVAWGPHQLQGATGGYNNNLTNTLKPFTIKKTSPARC